MLENHMTIGNGDHETLMTPAQQAALQEAAQDDAAECITEGDYWDDLPAPVAAAVKKLMNTYVNNWFAGPHGLERIKKAAGDVYGAALEDQTQREMSK